MSLRKLKYHEERLLRKVDFLQWKTDPSLRETKIMRKYFVQRREDYVKYDRMVGQVRSLCSKLKGLEPNDPVRIKTTEQLLQKLFDMGLINDKSSLLTAEKVTASAFCRRRLPVVLVRIKMCETLREAVEFVEHGHVRVGPHVVTDPAFLVSRAMEDHVTWVDTSKIRRAVSRYNDKLDDYDLMQS